MIWFELKQLETKISREGLTEREGLNYFIACSILSGLMVILRSSLKGSEASGQIITLLVFILLVPKLFSINEQKDGKDFFKRYFAISFVISMRLYSVYLIFFLMYIIAFQIQENSIFLSILSLLYTIAYCASMIGSFRRLSQW